MSVKEEDIIDFNNSIEEIFQSTETFSEILQRKEKFVLTQFSTNYLGDSIIIKDINPNFSLFDGKNSFIKASVSQPFSVHQMEPSMGVYSPKTNHEMTEDKKQIGLPQFKIPIYVNCKQFHRIQIRRQNRAKLEKTILSNKQKVSACCSKGKNVLFYLFL